MLVQTIRLLLALAASWVVLVGPAYLVAGLPAVVGLSAAVLLCLLPGIAVMALHAGPLASQQPFVGLMLAMGLRMAFVLGAVLMMREVRPDLSATVFVIWVVPTYLVALAVETHFAMNQPSSCVGVTVESAHLRAGRSS